MINIKNILRKERPENNRRNSKNKLKRSFGIFGIINLIVLALFTVSLLVPFIWSFITSFRDYFDYLINGGWAWPNPWVNNYSKVFEYFHVVIPFNGATRNVQIPEMLLNTILYALGSAILSMLASLLVAYVCAKYNFKFTKVIYIVVIIQMIVPIVGSLPSEIRMANLLHLYDNMFGMWIMKTYVTGTYFLVFYSSFKMIPKEYQEAAQIDGAGNFRIMVEIMFPFVKGTIYTIILLNFIAFWNDYQTPLIYMPSHPTLAYGLYVYVNGSYEIEISNTPYQLAGCMLMAVPLFIIFIAFQKKLLSNLSMGGLK